MGDAARRNGVGAMKRVALAAMALIAALALAACGDEDLGGGGTEEEVTVAEAGPVEGKMTMSTGVYYIDPGKGGKIDGEGSTIANFEEETGVDVNYLEDINSNESFFAKLRPDLQNGESGGRDIIVASDWMAKRYYDLGYAQKLDKSALPNVEANLVDSLRSPDFDPDRSFTVPWQSGITGLVVRSDLAPDITSVNDIFDPKYKGKIDVLAELRDTVPLVMKADGIDPADATKQQWLDAIDKIKGAIESGQIRDVTGNDYIEDLPRGDVVAAIGWAGDAAVMQLDNPDIEFVKPEEGCILWSDDMIIPVGAPNPGAAYAFMDYVYDPAHAAQIAGYVNYVTPVKGVREELRKSDPATAKQDLIFPTEEFTADCSPQPNIDPAFEKEVEEAWEEVTTG